MMGIEGMEQSQCENSETTMRMYSIANAQRARLLGRISSGNKTFTTESRRKTKHGTGATVVTGS